MIVYTLTLTHIHTYIHTHTHTQSGDLPVHTACEHGYLDLVKAFVEMEGKEHVLLTVESNVS